MLARGHGMYSYPTRCKNGPPFFASEGPASKRTVCCPDVGHRHAKRTAPGTGPSALSSA
jgi:hypothetical protein